MKGVLLKQIALVFVILKCANGIQVREDEAESDDVSSATPPLLGPIANTANVTFATEAPILNATSESPLNVNPASYRHLTNETSQTYNINR